MIEPTDEMIYAFAGEPEITATDAHAIRVGLAAVLAIVERDQAGPCSAVLDGLFGSGETWCLLRHGHAGDHLADNGLTRWKERSVAAEPGRPEMLSDRLGYPPQVGDADWADIQQNREMRQSMNADGEL